MNLDIVKNRIGTYLNSEKRWPIIVDLPSKESLSIFVDYFTVGDNKIVSAAQFCATDGTFKQEEFINTIANNEGNTLVVGLTAFLKLHGEEFTKRIFKSILSQSISGHIVVVTYQCKDYLNFSDIRFSERGQLCFVDGDWDTSCNICFISPDLADAFPGSYSGFEKLGEAYENDKQEVIYVATNVTKESFAYSSISVSQMSNSYSILCDKDSRTNSVTSNLGTDEQWNQVLKIMGINGNWDTVVDSQFGSVQGLADFVAQYNSYDDFKKWLYFIVLSILGVKQNSYLQYAVFNTACYEEFIKSLFRAILTIDYSDKNFQELYSERKEILSNFVDSLEEVVEFCKVISVKEKDAIYYLTDLTQPEKERVIDWLNTYGQEYTVPQLIEILRPAYPDLADYLSNFRFKNELLDSYFESYKYQKLINKILPSFEVVVDEQSEKQDFVTILPSRANIVDKLDFSKSHTFFFDALGVEYLGYIQAKCNKYGLSTNITCGKCELPSLTCFNKDFVDVCKAKGSTVSDIKSLDEIKHHGEDSFDYEKVKTPVYLISELAIIDDLLQKIKASIFSSHYEKAVIISDHGASRLAVLHESENLWRMATNGVHSGRCCPKNEIDSKPNFAIDEGGFWVLPNYDRFQGSRRANVEVHGGASLEEVTVPIIEITRKPTNIESFITDESKEIAIGAKEIPVVKIYVGINSNSIAIRIGEKYYDAEKTSEDYLYQVALPDITKKGVYTLDILDGSDTLASNILFEIKKKGMAENSLFD